MVWAWKITVGLIMEKQNQSDKSNCLWFPCLIPFHLCLSARWLLPLIKDLPVTIQSDHNLLLLVPGLCSLPLTGWLILGLFRTGSISLSNKDVKSYLHPFCRLRVGWDVFPCCVPLCPQDSSLRNNEEAGCAGPGRSQGLYSLHPVKHQIFSSLCWAQGLC